MKNKLASNVVASTAFAIAATFGFAAESHAEDVIQEGLFVIEVHDMVASGDFSYSRHAGCMIVSNNGQDTVPSLYFWNRPYTEWCGLSNNRDDIVGSRQAVWRIYPVSATDGQVAYVIKSHVNGQCLTRGNNGYAAHPSLHHWTGLVGGNAQFCGFQNADELIRNGQAAWNFSNMHNMSDTVFTHGITMGGPQPGRLAFAPPTVYPNTVDRDTFAQFTTETNPWLFVLLRL